MKTKQSIIIIILLLSIFVCFCIAFELIVYRRAEVEEAANYLKRNVLIKGVCGEIQEVSVLRRRAKLYWDGNKLTGFYRFQIHSANGQFKFQVFWTKEDNLFTVKQIDQIEGEKLTTLFVETSAQ